jgi:choline transport protein
VRKRSAHYLPETRKFKVPPALGWIANIVTVGFSLLCLVFWTLPTVFPVEPSNMSE